MICVRFRKTWKQKYRKKDRKTVKFQQRVLFNEEITEWGRQVRPTRPLASHKWLIICKSNQIEPKPTTTAFSVVKKYP